MRIHEIAVGTCLISKPQKYECSNNGFNEDDKANI